MWVAGLRDSAVLRLAPAGLNSSVYGYTCMTVCIGIRHDEKVSLHSLTQMIVLKLHGYCQNAVKDFPQSLRLFMGLLFEI